MYIVKKSVSLSFAYLSDYFKTEFMDIFQENAYFFVISNNLQLNYVYIKTDFFQLEQHQEDKMEPGNFKQHFELLYEEKLIEKVALNIKIIEVTMIQSGKLYSSNPV